MKNIILEIKNLSKYYDDSNDKKNILENFNLEVENREFVCILGPSGCGKSTLIRCIAGFEKFSGEVYISGKKEIEPSTDRIMVFQDFNQLFPWKTAINNIKYPLILKGIKDKKEIDSIAKEALSKVNLLDYANYYPFQLSGGMKQRVAIAKAIALKPKIILMDEPFAALDAISRRDLQNELLEIAEKEEITFVFVTHNIQEAIVLGTRILVMNVGGRIAFDKKNVLERPVTPASNGYGELWQDLYDALYHG